MQTLLNEFPLMRHVVLISVAVIWMLARPAVAQTSAASESDQIREELGKLKQDYEQRIRALEERLRKLDATSGTGTTNLVPVPAPATTTAASTNATARAREFSEQEFQRDTESREQSLLYERRPFTERVEQVWQDFVDIHGYFRAGYGRDDQGGPQVAF